MVTAEVAVLLPVLVLLTVLALRAIGAGRDQLECVDAARAGARAAARGDAAGDVRRIIGSLAPAGAQISVIRRGDRIRVEVAARASLLPGVGVGLHAAAEAVVEE